ncbi:MAG TPA: hypothetical protein VI455_16940 [Terriglobia bacterium]
MGLKACFRAGYDVSAKLVLAKSLAGENRQRKALYFLDGKLANDIMAAYKKNDGIKSFLDNPSSPEVDIDVQQVALEPMDQPPYKASVDLYLIQYSPVDHSVLKKTLYTATFVFMFRSNVPSALIPINPLGLTITYFREDEAFK